MPTPPMEPGRAQAGTAEDETFAVALPEVTAALVERGVARVPGRWPNRAAAWRASWRVIDGARAVDPMGAGLPRLAVAGEFTVPPPGVVQRDFQALHIDFGVPRLTGAPVDVARFTALYVDGQRTGAGAATRIVPLGRLLGQRAWPARAVLAGRLRGEAGDGALVEGILARIIEAADQSRDLPDRAADGFLCGMEFSALPEERQYFASHGMDLAAVEQEIALSAGELLLFDNLAVAHGRRGRRAPGELHQLCVGFRSLGLPGQGTLLDRFLADFAPGAGTPDTVPAPSRP